jgi:beta-galactosidase
MRRNMALNGGWRYRADFRDEYLDPSYSIGSWDEVDLPHANKELPFNGFDESCYQFVSAYALDLDIPLAYWGGAQEAGRRLFLDFEGVMTACEIWVNGKAAGGHKGGYTPFSVEIGGFAKPGAPNRILVRVDSTERADIPPFGHVIDYLCYGGIYREASLRSQGESWIADLFAWPERALEDRKTLCVRVETAGETSGLELGLALRECGAGPKAAVLGELRAPLEPGPDGAARLDLEGLAGLRLWELEDPALYLLEATLYRGGEAVDFLSHRVGFRTAQWKPGGFYLNGRRKKLVGLNRHQSWPYVGYAMPARVQRRDAEILKRELCLDIVRTSHYPQSVHFLDRCDELGLLVLEELPGWQHIGDAAWKDAACLALEEMIRRDRSRPSIVLWGLRINESRDDPAGAGAGSETSRRASCSRTCTPSTTSSTRGARRPSGNRRK